MIRITYLKTYKSLHNHKERFHNEFGQENRGIKREGLKDSEEHLKKRNKVHNK